MPREYVSVLGHAKTGHDFMLVNEEMKPFVLTLWEDFAMNQGWDITSLLESGRHPIILGKRVTVTPFNGLMPSLVCWLELGGAFNKMEISTPPPINKMEISPCTGIGFPLFVG
ncbi:unnamed protein product [Cuscuta campestris]|uniref:Uncharacterized protein n=1 Tax=Cuscuta campestris TaxID=132261 RepID=A0A484MP10_9ASTE|nr:unnamed protein product [Cuscuta campestris]